VPLKTDLTSADLDAVRKSALDAADPLGVAAELAEAADGDGLADPDDAGYALTLAAEIAESRGKLDAALRYADRAVAAYGTRDDNHVGATRALRSRILFRAGREDEAMAGLDELRPLLTRYPDAAAYVSAALAAGGRNRVAEQWLSEAVQSVLAERKSEPADAEDAGLLFFVLQQRHRVRHALGLPHDVHDNIADRLETELAGTAARAAAAREDSLLFWPRPEFDALLAKWPDLAEDYGATWDEHRAGLERELVRTGRTDLAVLDGKAAALSGPDDRNAYARRLAAAPGHLPWPPERNAACWCGSGNKYKKCCLPRSRS
jgi:hypothetical protein